MPWVKILTHKGVWAIIIAHIGQTWGQLVLYSEVPAYMNNIIGVDIKAVTRKDTEYIIAQSQTNLNVLCYDL